MRCAIKFYPFGFKCVCSSYCFYADHTINEFCNLNRVITLTTVVEGPGLQTRRLNMSKPGKDDDDDSRDWMIGSLGRSKKSEGTEISSAFIFVCFHYALVTLLFMLILHKWCFYKEAVLCCSMLISLFFAYSKNEDKLSRQKIDWCIKLVER